MADWLNLAMLVCAALGAMAFGILAAYGILRITFSVLRPQPTTVPAVEPQTEAAGLR
jgi:hypothetical protein